jgi:hypothetical protein
MSLTAAFGADDDSELPMSESRLLKDTWDHASVEFIREGEFCSQPVGAVVEWWWQQLISEIGTPQTSWRPQTSWNQKIASDLRARARIACLILADMTQILPPVSITVHAKTRSLIYNLVTRRSFELRLPVSDDWYEIYGALALEEARARGDLQHSNGLLISRSAGSAG